MTARVTVDQAHLDPWRNPEIEEQRCAVESAAPRVGLTFAWTWSLRADGQALRRTVRTEQIVRAHLAEAAAVDRAALRPLKKPGKLCGRRVAAGP